MWGYISSKVLFTFRTYPHQCFRLSGWNKTDKIWFTGALRLYTYFLHKNHQNKKIYNNHKCYFWHVTFPNSIYSKIGERKIWYLYIYQFPIKGIFLYVEKLQHILSRIIQHFIVQNWYFFSFFKTMWGVYPAPILTLRSSSKKKAFKNILCIFLSLFSYIRNNDK